LTHPTKKLGLNPHGKPDALLLAVHWAAGRVPDHQVAADHMTGVTPGLDGNDRYGDCGPTSVDNHNRITTKFEAGTQIDATLEQVFDLYRASGNPNFNPDTDADDNGVAMDVMLDALRKHGLAGKKILGYGRLADTSDASIMAAIDLFGAVLFAVTLQNAQQDATVWDYQPTPVWGGHAIAAAAYNAAAGSIDVFSWAERHPTTAAFRKNQLDEVWVPLWPEVVASDTFAQHIAVAELAADFEALTGATFPVSPTPVPPAPTPTPAPVGPTPPPVVDPAVVAFHDAVLTWSRARHWPGSNRKAAEAASAMFKALGLVQ
jgi:hypothetical protein